MAGILPDTSPNERIAKNTVYLYLRTAIVLCVTLYTSRMVLQVLGAADLGIYNVVGGIVALLAFFQTAQTKATSRFITYELGLDSPEEVRRSVFSSCLTIHLLIVIVVLILGETVGLLMVRHLTDIPLERQPAAMWVYQFSLLTFCVHMIRIPYDSVIIAYEEMSVYAYLTVLEAALKLGVVLLLVRSASDSLILYGGMLAVAAIVVLLCFELCVRFKHREYRFRIEWSPVRFRQILSFSGWTMMGSATNTVSQQGVGLLFNNFVGLVANAALGFANQVNAALCSFVSSFSTAFNPQIIKLAADREHDGLFTLMFRASKFSFALAYVMALPMILNMDFLLDLWLVDVPEFTVRFCQLVLICSVIDATTGVFNTAITANGKIKTYQICISVSFTLDFIIALFLLRLSVNPAVVFGSRIFTRGFLNMCIGLHFCRKQIDFDVREYLKRVAAPILLTIILTLIPALCIQTTFTSRWASLISGTVWSLVSVSLCLLFVIMTANERKTVVLRAKEKLTGRKYGQV